MVKKVIWKETKVKRVNTNLKNRKAPTKSDFELQANNALEEINRITFELKFWCRWAEISGQQNIA